MRECNLLLPRRIIASLFLVACGSIHDEKHGLDAGQEGGTAGSSPEGRDGDGSPNGENCRPDDPTVWPGGAEHCDGLDHNCNALADEGDVCPATCTPLRRPESDRHYLACARVGTWNDALSLCMSARLSLATVDDVAESWWITEALYSRQGEVEWWIGGRTRAPFTTWRWLDERVFDDIGDACRLRELGRQSARRLGRLPVLSAALENPRDQWPLLERSRPCGSPSLLS